MMGGDDSGEGSTSKGDSTMIPGYTGHVHKLQETYGSTFAKAANLVTKCPPETPEPFSCSLSVLSASSDECASEACGTSPREPGRCRRLATMCQVADVRVLPDLQPAPKTPTSSSRDPT
mmetsp:Transcript_18481/g.60666  ORF Transcript_18481/g.60666 Transcript_18481/m.60666 type:complete len:119 (-) Transcript_18481:692-1048(-)